MPNFYSRRYHRCRRDSDRSPKSTISNSRGRKIGRMIRTPNHRPAGNMHKTHLARLLAVLVKLRWRNKCCDWQVLQGGLEILAESQDITTSPPQILHGYQ